MRPGIWLGSVEGVAATWLVAAGLVAALLLRRPGRPWRDLGGDEAGSTYVLSYVMIFPLYCLLIGLVIETSMILVAKTGTIYAAFAGARARVVWDSAAPDLAAVKVRHATIRALTPFASGSDRHLRGAGVPAAPSTDAARTGAAYRAHGGTAGGGYVADQYGYADAATTIELPPPGEPEAGVVDLAVRLTYQKPLLVPVISRVFGPRAPWPGADFRCYAITSTVALPDEAPRNPERSLGIDYSSR